MGGIVAQKNGGILERWWWSVGSSEGLRSLAGTDARMAATQIEDPLVKIDNGKRAETRDSWSSSRASNPSPTARG